MKEKRIITGITILMILIYAGIIVGWHFFTSKEQLTLQIPGADNRPNGATRSASDVLIGEFFMKYEEDKIETALTGKWNGFRGKDFNNIITTKEQINISDEDYPVLWSIETGEGYAAPVIYNGLVYFLDYDESLKSDALRCFSLETGKELWRRWYRVPIKRNHGFSRTVPAIGDDYIITIGPNGHVMCCDPSNGSMRWSLDMQKEYNSVIPQWNAGQCPFVDDDMLVLAPSGDDVLLTGLDRLTGEVRWSTSNTLGYRMSHSTVMPMMLSNKKTYIYVGVGGVCGISAEKEDLGTLLWETNKWQPTTAAPSPLQISNNQIFLTAGYGTGGAMLQVVRQGDKWTATITDQYKPRDGLSSEQHTPLFYNNMIITIIPKEGAFRERLVCYDPTNIRTPIWSSAADERFGLGPYFIINNYLFAFKEDGELYVYEVQKRGMTLLKKQRIMQGKDAYRPMAYADGMLILGDDSMIKCLKIN